MAEENVEKRGVTIVVFSGELDKALAAFNIANTAAAMDLPVTMFFTFWGLGVDQKRRGRWARATGWKVMG